MQRKSSETIQELVARIRQDAATCDLSSIQGAQDEALKTRFICLVNTEAVLKALFKIKDDDMNFARGNPDRNHSGRCCQDCQGNRVWLLHQASQQDLAGQEDPVDTEEALHVSRQLQGSRQMLLM